MNVVTKLNVMLMSLPASVPAAYLSFLLVMVFLGYGGGDTVIHQALAGTTLGLSALVAVLPVGILLFYQGPPTPKKIQIQESATSLIESLNSGDDRTMSGEDVSAMDEVISTSQSDALEVAEEAEGFDLGGFGESEGDLEEVGEIADLEAPVGDDIFEGVVDEITDTDELEIGGGDSSTTTLEDEEIADFDDLFGEDDKQS